MRMPWAETKLQRTARLKSWHPFFAILPIDIGDSVYCLRWLERKGTVRQALLDSWWEWEYRLRRGA